MVGLGISFDFGRYHATPWGANVNDGAVEWPPSPWRILRTLYAATRVNVRLRDERDAIDRALLELAASAPPSYELPPSSAAHTRHYMPLRDYSPANPGQTSRVLDAFRAVDPDAELRVWWEARLPPEDERALERAAAAVGYLGRSESLCSIRLLRDEAPAHPAAVPAGEQADLEGAEITDLLCPTEVESLDQLTASVAELRQDGRLLPPGAGRVSYAVRTDDDATVTRRPSAPSGTTIALFRITGAQRPGIVEAVAVGQSLRRRAMGAFGRGREGEDSPTLSGHRAGRPRSDQHQHAHYLVASDRDSSRVDHLAIWAPEGFGRDELLALTSIDSFRLRGQAEEARVALAAIGDAENLDIPWLLGPSDRWHSLTPFGLVRHPKRRGGRIVDSPVDQIAREFHDRGMPQPDEIVLERGSWHRYRRSRAGRSRLDRTPVVGARITFSKHVSGPIALGALSHFGLGLFTPER